MKRVRTKSYAQIPAIKAFGSSPSGKASFRIFIVFCRAIANLLLGKNCLASCDQISDNNGSIESCWSRACVNKFLLLIRKELKSISEQNEEKQTNL